ncbi:MAG: FAD-dependent monooxygenase [Rhabdochlamydiaceae bacterium]|nr:FAD-dependent monooxygenase [Rhabdochlamydiaceae bacterium]
MAHLSSGFADSISEDCIKVLIVGAGPCGLSVAKALQNRGIFPDLIEKEDQIRSDGAGIAIPANGTWALNQLGIDIGSNALLIQSMQFTDDQGDILAQEKIDALHPEGAQFYSLGRDELVKQLLSHLDKRTQIQTSTTLNSFSEENDKVLVEFSNGKIKSYDLVIGCDGVHSSLRKQIHPNELPEFLGLLVWRAVIDAPEEIMMPTYMLGSDRLVLLYPMPSNQTYVYGHIFQPEKRLPTQGFSQVFSCFGGLVPNALHTIDQQNLAGKNVHYYIHHMEKSHSVRFKLDGFSRVLLLGDAAHAFGPMLQNGAAQAFEDAYVLQDLIENKMKSEKVTAFIEAFEKRRRERVQNIFAMSNIKIQAISDPQQIQGRNEAIRKMGAPNVHGFRLIMQQNP